MDKKGTFVISLDFELFWGVRDVETISSYGEYILGVWEILPRLLELFKQYNVNVTFATVGFLYASDKKELQKYFPIEFPQYFETHLSPYSYFENIEEKDKYHFGLELVNLIKEHPNHEFATHTFSHYYCLEKGQTLETFKADLNAAISIGNSKSISQKSLVFPRHQFNQEYLEVCKEFGISSYRGNESSWFYNAGRYDQDSLSKRAFRLLDVYLNISGHNCCSMVDIAKEYPFNIPSSRFLRPYSSSLKWLENLRLKRILKSMDYAAKQNEVFHLWWHPHNFGIYQEENFNFLEKILIHFQKLNQQYDFESKTMLAISQAIQNEYSGNS